MFRHFAQIFVTSRNPYFLFFIFLFYFIFIYLFIFKIFSTILSVFPVLC